MTSDKPSEVERTRRFFASKNWPMMRKVEALIFLALFVAVPLFAFRVMQYTHAQLVILSVTRGLVSDLQHAKVMAMDRKQIVKVNNTDGFRTLFQGRTYCSYVISSANKIFEEVVLPENVTLVGNVTFLESGKPGRPASFIVSSFNRASTVEIDTVGIISVP